MTSAARYIKSASCYNQRYQRRSSMYIRGLIQRNFAELAEEVPIDYRYDIDIAYCVQIYSISMHTCDTKQKIRQRSGINTIKHHT